MSGIKEVPIANLHNLLNGVVKEAAKEYQEALCKGDVKVIKENEKFFTGDTFNVFTELDGPTLMEDLKNEVIDCDYDMKKLKSLHRRNGVKEESC